MNVLGFHFKQKKEVSGIEQELENKNFKDVKPKQKERQNSYLWACINDLYVHI